MIEQDLHDYLLSQPEIENLVGDRMYPIQFPQDTAFPVLVYNHVSGSSLYNSDGSSHYGPARIQIDCFAKDDYGQMVDLAEAVRKALAGYIGPMGSTPDVASRVVNVMDVSEPEVKLFRRMVEISLWHQEA